MSLQSDPPAVLERLLQRALAASPYRDDIVGDLREGYAAVVRRHRRAADASVRHARRRSDCDADDDFTEIQRTPRDGICGRLPRLAPRSAGRGDRS
ncbi:MAG: hypothetical protein DMF99_21900 [Acidobacteria bacterium]|nr:MAG: hypothetical protein DMF99_21900 [Acidobacteriota bacterium]